MNRGRLVIAGGGPVGLVSALLLRPYFAQVTVLERNAAEAAGGRSLQLVLGERGLHALRCCGLDQQVKAQGVPVYGRMDGETGAFTPYGASDDAILAVSRVALQSILEQAVDGLEGIERRSAVTVTGVDRTAKNVHCDTPLGPEILGYDMLIGADGVRSVVAESILEEEEVTLDKLPLVYREVPVAKVGWRSDAFVYWSDGEVMVGSFPGKEGRRGLFVMHPRGAEHLLFNEGNTGLFARFPGLAFLGNTLLEALSAANAGAMGSKTCARWTSDEVVIIGDAAHAIVPFMGQGLNTGLEDAVCLMRQFRSSSASPCDEVLRRFARRRQAPADAIRRLSDRHARHLMGVASAVDVALEERAGAALHAVGMPDTYAACAFSRNRFDRILSAEWRAMKLEIPVHSRVA